MEPGDTLTAIARRTGVPADQIARQNHLTDPNRIYARQRLTLEPPAPARAPAATGAPGVYTVRAGDTLSSISRATGVPVDRLVHANHLANPNRIYAGQRLHVSAPGAAAAALSKPSASPPAPPAPPMPVHGVAARRILIAAARERGVDPSYVLAVSLWESGYNQGMISSAGAIGLMQILPSTADWAGPALLGRRVDLTDANDNARLGAALLRLYLDQFKDPKLALAAYYQGAAATRKDGVYPSSRQYVDGISALNDVMKATSPGR